MIVKTHGWLSRSLWWEAFAVANSVGHLSWSGCPESRSFSRLPTRVLAGGRVHAAKGQIRLDSIQDLNSFKGFGRDWTECKHEGMRVWRWSCRRICSEGPIETSLRYWSWNYLRGVTLTPEVCSRWGHPVVCGVRACGQLRRDGWKLLKPVSVPWWGLKCLERLRNHFIIILERLKWCKPPPPQTCDMTAGWRNWPQVERVQSVQGFLEKSFISTSVSEPTERERGGDSV